MKEIIAQRYGINPENLGPENLGELGKVVDPKELDKTYKKFCKEDIFDCKCINPDETPRTDYREQIVDEEFVARQEKINAELGEVFGKMYGKVELVTPSGVLCVNQNGFARWEKDKGITKK